ncbi:MAG: methylenetetrahydrofolate reductase [Dehalococcoidia bacterium]|nr:methylenetetrahydrofolate reductase [Dehalococcoidia bacterium]MCB9483313.1 methylenetetrahydrofolate reductase [Dehalococcoidia bacterium]
MTKITDLLKAGPTLSFEFSAPRDPEGERRLDRTLARLARLDPSFMSVTYGAGGSSRGPTAEVVHHIRHDLGVEAVPHLVCVAHTRDEIAAFVDGYRADGVENILALHGDLPEGSTEATGHFTRAMELVAFIRERGDFAVAVAAHPEGHPRAANREDDRDHQAEKLRSADLAMTQFFFRAEYYERFLEDMAARGVTTPVIPGIMPPTNIEGIARMSAMNNTEFPAEVRKRLEDAGDDVDARRAIGVEVATKVCEDLIRLGAPGIHLYTLNFSQAVLEVVRNLGLRVEASAD